MPSGPKTSQFTRPYECIGNYGIYYKKRLSKNPLNPPYQGDFSKNPLNSPYQGDFSKNPLNSPYQGDFNDNKKPASEIGCGFFVKNKSYSRLRAAHCVASFPFGSTGVRTSKKTLSNVGAMRRSASVGSRRRLT